MVSRYPYIDRNYCILPAGKSFGDPCTSVKDAMYDIGTDEKIEVLRKQHGFVDPKNYQLKTKNFDYTGDYSEIKHYLMPQLKTQFQCIEDEIKNTIYDSYWNKPLGKTRDHVPGIPKGMDPYCTTFGKVTQPPFPSGEDINPRKTPGQIIYEDKICHDLYKLSHQNYYPGERIERGYSLPFCIDKTYGFPTHADHSGAKAKKAMTWFNNDPISNVSRRQAAVRERTSAPMGQTLDKTGVSNMFDINHSFGKPLKKDACGVEDLLNEYSPSILRRDMREFISYANKLRRKVHSIINLKEIRLEEIFDDLSKLDENKTLCLHFDCIETICKKYYIYLDKNKLLPLLLILGILKPDGTLNYKDFLNFLDLNRNFPPLQKEHYITPLEYQIYDKEHGFKVSNVNCTCQNYLNKVAGMPTIPINKSYPYYINSRSNIDHLGAETTARALIAPSIYTQYGLTHRDFFKSRSKEFLMNLFKRIGCTLSDDDVNEIYEEGLQMDNSGGVCIETFRNLLDVRAYKTYQRL